MVQAAAGNGAKGPCCDDHDFGDDAVLNIRPYNNRGCTDIIPLCGFFAFLCLMYYMTGLAIANGNPRDIVYGKDVYGRMCGFSSGVEDKPYAAAISPLAMLGPYVCVSDCLETEDTDDARWSIPMETVAFKGAYCLPFNISNIYDVMKNKGEKLIKDEGSDGDKLKNKNDTSFGESSSFAGGAAALQNAVGDVMTAAPVIGASLPIAVIIAFVYIYFLRGCAGPLVWIMLTFLGLCLLLFGVALMQWAQEQEDLQTDPPDPRYDEDMALAARISGGIFLGLFAIYVIVILVLRKRIMIAIEVIKEGSRALNAMPWMIVFPIFPFVYLIGFFVLWVIVALYMYSVSNVAMEEFPKSLYNRYYNPTLPTPPSVVIGYEPTVWLTDDTTKTGFYVGRSWDDQFKTYFVIHFFGLLWNVQFVVYYAYLILAGATAQWYFTPRTDEDLERVQALEARLEEEGKVEKDEESDHHHSKAPILSSVRRTTRYHLGTVAVASFIIAVVQFIRAMVKYIEEQTKTKNNPVQRCLFCCLQCCLKCVECCMDKISKNALIMTAVYGDNFATGACKSFSLLWNNMGRVAAINLVSGYLTFIGKLMVAFFTAMLCVWIIGSVYKDEVSSTIVPGFLCLILAYFVGTLFMVVYDTVVDVIFLCFLIDEQMNKDIGMLAGEELRELVESQAAKSAAIAAYKQAKTPEEARAAHANYKTAFDGNLTQVAPAEGVAKPTEEQKE